VCLGFGRLFFEEGGAEPGEGTLNKGEGLIIEAVVVVKGVTVGREVGEVGEEGEVGETRLLTSSQLLRRSFIPVEENDLERILRILFFEEEPEDEPEEVETKSSSFPRCEVGGE
jgi:hypothetical protein